MLATYQPAEHLRRHPDFISAISAMVILSSLRLRGVWTQTASSGFPLWVKKAMWDFAGLECFQLGHRTSPPFLLPPPPTHPTAPVFPRLPPARQKIGPAAREPRLNQLALREVLDAPVELTIPRTAYRQLAGGS